ncbi:hypothetical protein [Candidatus Phycosocius spiralis]|uniref:hypothetical protein n=1 Tax=Candidatus Phycosocius spiralis TaxID=2815099 RepID=UPI0024E13173|nr:hypothetical protein [Candidatus Phycosocius spiralis]
MRLIMVSGAALTVIIVFGLGVVVGKFVLSSNPPVANSPSNAILDPAGLVNPLADPDAAVGSDPNVITPPPAPLPAPPASAINEVVIATPSNLPPESGVHDETELSMSADKASSQCDIKVNQSLAIRSWKSLDKVTIMATGPDCASGNIRIMLETAEGRALYTLQAPTRDFGIAANANADQIKDRLSGLLPPSALKASDYPAWPVGSDSPTRSEFTRETYETIRDSGAPVVCLKLPSSAQRCVAQDPKSGQFRVFARG